MLHVKEIKYLKCKTRLNFKVGGRICIVIARIIIAIKYVQLSQGLSRC